MTDLNGGHLVARTLKQAGVRHIFTLCGGHILPIYDGCLSEGIAVVDMRHEQACAHAGDAYARLTRNIGVAAVTAGPGVTDAVTGVANAHSARSPLLLIGGAAPLGLRGLGALQETEQVALLRPITKGSWTVAETRQIPEVLTTAIRTALTGRPGPVFVEIPVDLLMTVIEDRLAPIPSGYVHRSAALADPADVDRLAQLIARAERPARDGGQRRLLGRRRGIARALRGGRGHPGLHERGGAGLAAAESPGRLRARARVRAGPRRPRPRARRAARLPPRLRTAAELCRGCARRHDRLRSRGARAEPPARDGPLRTYRPHPRSARRRAARRRAGARRPHGAARLAERERDARDKLLAESTSDQVPVSHYRWAAEIAAAVTPDTIVVGDGGDVVGCASKFVP